MKTVQLNICQSSSELKDVCINWGHYFPVTTRGYEDNTCHKPKCKWLDKGVSSSKAGSHKNLASLLCLHPLVPLSCCQETLPILRLHQPSSSKPSFCHILREILFVSPKVNHKLQEVAVSPQWNIWEAPLTKSHCDIFISPLRLIENACWVEETRGKKVHCHLEVIYKTVLHLVTKLRFPKHVNTSLWTAEVIGSFFSHFLWAVRRKQAGHHHVTTEEQLFCLGHWPTKQVDYTVLWIGTVQDAQYLIKQVFSPVIEVSVVCKTDFFFLLGTVYTSPV